VKEQELEQIKAYLLALRRGTLSYCDQCALIHCTSALVQAHLHTHRKSYTYLFKKTGIAEKELAIDCIADAFARNSHNEFFRIQHCLSQLSAPLENTPAKEIFLLYKSFILRIADIRLARLFASFDNAGTNIKRNILESLKSCHHFQLRREFSGIALLPSNDDALREHQQFPIHELERLFLLRLDGKRSTKNLLNTLHSILIEQNDYSRSLSLNSVVQLFKKGYPQDIEDANLTSDEDDAFCFLCTDNTVTEFEMEDAIQNVLATIKEKIFTMYLLTQKLTTKEAEGIYFALREWIEDAKSSQIQVSLKEYFTSYVSISDTMYDTRIATRIEYLKKLLKREFQSYFDERV
jgi:hypothetical protein